MSTHQNTAYPLDSQGMIPVTFVGHETGQPITVKVRPPVLPASLLRFVPSDWSGVAEAASGERWRIRPLEYAQRVGEPRVVREVRLTRQEVS